MSRLTYKQIRANTITPDSLQRLFQVVTDDRTAALAMFYVSIHDAKDDGELEKIRKVLRGKS